MSKGFGKFIGKKDFHPSSYQNRKKVWEAKQAELAKERRQEELRLIQEKEQEMFDNKALLGNQKSKLGLSWMYDVPAGVVVPQRELRLTWQRPPCMAQQDEFEVKKKGEDNQILMKSMSVGYLQYMRKEVFMKKSVLSAKQSKQKEANEKKMLERFKSMTTEKKK